MVSDSKVINSILAAVTLVLILLSFPAFYYVFILDVGFITRLFMRRSLGL